MREDRITLIAAGVAFYAMLALFPAMIVVVSIYGLVMDPEEIADIGCPGDRRDASSGRSGRIITTWQVSGRLRARMQRCLDPAAVNPAWNWRGGGEGG